MQNDLEVNEEDERFTVKLATEHPQQRGYLFLSREDEFMIIDTSDINHTTNSKDSEVDLTQGEITYIKENYEASVEALQSDEKNLETLGSVLDSQNHEEWVDKTQDRITLHVNFKEDNFGKEAKEIATTYNLKLIKEDYSTLKYKDRLSK